jgi:hypothetical protein
MPNGTNLLKRKTRRYVELQQDDDEVRFVLDPTLLVGFL